MKFSSHHRGVLICGAIVSLAVFLYAPTSSGQLEPLFTAYRPPVDLARLVAIQGVIVASTVLLLMVADWLNAIDEAEKAREAEEAAYFAAEAVRRKTP